MRVVGKTVDLHASCLPRCVDAGSEASSNGVKLESITRGRALRCVRGRGGARRYGVGHADGGRDNFLIDDRQYVGCGSALVHRVDERLLCVDKRLELEHRKFKLVQELCTCVVQELGVLCRGAGAERAKERVVFGDGVQSVGESNAAGLFVFFDGVSCCSWHQLVRMRGARRSRQDTQRVRRPGRDRVGGDTGIGARRLGDPLNAGVPRGCGEIQGTRHDQHLRCSVYVDGCVVGVLMNVDG